MINKFVNERTVMILTSVGLFYFLYTKYLELTQRQEYLEQNVSKMVEHLNRLTIDQVVREVAGDDEINSTTVEHSHSTDNDDIPDLRVQSDGEFSYIQSDEPLDTEEEDFDHPTDEAEETIIISNRNHEVVKGSQCSVVLHSGKRKGFVCGKPATDGFCKIHKNKTPKPQDDTPLDRMGDVNVVEM